MSLRTDLVVGSFDKRKIGDVIERVKAPGWQENGVRFPARLVGEATREDYEACLRSFGFDPDIEPFVPNAHYYFAVTD